MAATGPLQTSITVRKPFLLETHPLGYPPGACFVTAARISRSFAFTRAALSGPMRSMIFCPSDSFSSSGSAKV